MVSGIGTPAMVGWEWNGLMILGRWVADDNYCLGWHIFIVVTEKAG